MFILWIRSNSLPIMLWYSLKITVSSFICIIFFLCKIFDQSNIFLIGPNTRQSLVWIIDYLVHQHGALLTTSLHTIYSLSRRLSSTDCGSFSYLRCIFLVMKFEYRADSLMPFLKRVLIRKWISWQLNVIEIIR